MKIKEIIKREGTFKENIIPLLTDQIFHITSYENYEKILESWFIENNKNLGTTGTTSHSQNSYLNKRWYVCLFDGRKWEKKLEEQLWKRLNYAKLWTRYVIFFLSKDSYKNIKEFDLTKVNKKWEIIIPFIEVWYKNNISINEITKIIIVSRKQSKYKEWSHGWLAHNAEKYIKKYQ